MSRDGDFAGEAVEGCEVEGDARALRDCGEVDEAVGRAADGLENDHGVAKGGGGKNVRLEPGSGRWREQRRDVRWLRGDAAAVCGDGSGAAADMGSARPRASTR